eukprot:4625915-Amphidinium_carterae.1
MHLDVSDCSGHVAVQSALSVRGRKVCQSKDSKHVHVTFHDGLSACHDVCVPSYRFMELGGQVGLVCPILCYMRDMLGHF